MLWLFILFLISVFFLYRDPKGHDAIYTFKTEEKKPGKTLSIMTYNIGFGAGLEGLKGVTYPKTYIQINLEAITKTISHHNPDIVCVQEIDIRSKRSYKIDQVRYIAETCGYPYVAVAYTWNRYYIPFPFTLDIRKHFGKVLAGQAIFSKYPIKSHVVLALPEVNSKPWWYRFFYLHHVLQTVTIQLGDHTVDIANVHFEAFDKTARQKQADYVAYEIEDTYKQLPLFIAGDFNALETPKTSLIFEDEPGVDYGSDATIGFFKRLPFLKSATDSNGPTFPSNTPNRKLDYIFYNPTFFKPFSEKRCDDAKTASDHLPVYAEFMRNVSQDLNEEN